MVQEDYDPVVNATDGPYAWPNYLMEKLRFNEHLRILLEFGYFKIYVTLKYQLCSIIQ